MRIRAGALLALFAAGGIAPAQAADEKFIFDVEWRLIHAGTATLESRKGQASLKLESAGIVSSLFKIQDEYQIDYEDSFCATSSVLDAMEGKHHNETRIKYDRAQNHAFFVERDLLKNSVIRETGVDVPNCVSDVLLGLLKLRTMSGEPGQSVQIPTTDGRKFASVKTEVQEREQVKTPLGSFKTIRYEPLLLNGVIYARKGHVQIWLSDDARRVPVQIRLRLNFPLGTVTLQLIKQQPL